MIGAGASGLAAAAELARAGEDVVVLERAEIGAVWAGRYDRLHLHTVRWLSGLPGYAIPRRFGKESRPFLTEPWPFLCAMACSPR